MPNNRMRRSEKPNLLSIVLYGVSLLAIFIFLVYFLLLGGKFLLLLSFLVFLALSLLISRKRTATAIVLVASGVAILAAGAIYALSPGPVSINIGILGYYLLISGTLAVFLDAIYERRLRGNKTITRAIRFASSNSARLSVLWIALCIALFLLPVWPIGVKLHLSQVPYIPLNLHGISNGSVYPGNGYYTLYLNLSEYSAFLNPQGSNIRFYYRNGSEIQSWIYARTSPNQSSMQVALYLNSNSIFGDQLRAYILQYGTGFDNYAMPAYANSSIVSYGLLMASVGNLTNGTELSNATVYYQGLAWSNYSENLSVSVYPYLLTEPICTPGIYRSTTLHFSSSAPISVFAFYSLDNFSAAYGNSAGNTYQYYLSRFPRYSYAHAINSTNGTIGIAYAGQCAYYAVVTGRQVNVSIRTSSRYYANLSYSKVLGLPPAVSSSTYYSYYSFSYLPQSLAYLYSYYLNETRGQN